MVIEKIDNGQKEQGMTMKTPSIIENWISVEYAFGFSFSSDVYKIGSFIERIIDAF